MSEWHKTEQQKLFSPCVHECSMNGEMKLCHGCFRTRDEVKHWRKLDMTQRKEVLQQAKIRKQQYQAD